MISKRFKFQFVRINNIGVSIMFHKENEKNSIHYEHLGHKSGASTIENMFTWTVGILLPFCFIGYEIDVDKIVTNKHIQ